jgi:hypothetical protein
MTLLHPAKLAGVRVLEVGLVRTRDEHRATVPRSDVRERQQHVDLRVRSHCRVRNRCTEYDSDPGIKWMGGGTERQCDRALGDLPVVEPPAGVLGHVPHRGAWPSGGGFIFTPPCLFRTGTHECNIQGRAKMASPPVAGGALAGVDPDGLPRPAHAPKYIR